jgi:hypothetical protein
MQATKLSVTTGNPLVNELFLYLNEHCEDQTLNPEQKEQVLQEIANNYFIALFPDLELIKQQYKKISLILHPDKLKIDKEKFIDSNILFGIVKNGYDGALKNYIKKLILDLNNRYRELGNSSNPFMPKINNNDYEIASKTYFSSPSSYIIERLKTKKLLARTIKNPNISPLEQKIIHILSFSLIDFPMIIASTIKNELFYFALFLYIKIPLRISLFLLWPYFGSLTSLQAALNPYAIPIILLAIISNGAFLDGICVSLNSFLHLCALKNELNASSEKNIIKNQFLRSWELLKVIFSSPLTRKEKANISNKIGGFIWHVFLDLLAIFTASLYLFSNILNVSTHFISGLIQRSMFEIICAPFLLFKKKIPKTPITEEQNNPQNIANIQDEILPPAPTFLYSNNKLSTYTSVLSVIPEDCTKSPSPKLQSSISDVD